MKKKKFLYLILICCLLSITTVVVYAAATDYNGGSNASYQDGSGKTTWTSQTAGVRISFVSSTGYEYSVKDYYVNSDYTNTSVLVTTNKLSKVGYATSGAEISFTRPTTVGATASLLSNLQSIIDSSAFSGKIRLESDVINFSYKNTFDALKKSKNLKDPNFSQKIKDFWVSFSGLSDDIIASRDVFLVFEPLSIAKINGTYYLGSSHELANIAKASKGGGFYSTSKQKYPCAYAGSNSLCDLGSILKRRLPCGAYLVGTLYDEMKSIIGDSPTENLENILNRFSSNSYFGGAINLLSSAPAVCGSNKGEFSDDTSVDAHLGIGMGIVWVGEGIESEGCDLIIPNIDDKNWETKFNTAYESGGLQNIYNSYPTNYITYNNGAQQVDLKWFVNECTCYGIYDYYTNSRITAYTNSVSSVINELSVKIGTPNWYAVAPLSETKGWLIEAKINSGAFDDFINKNKTYAESLSLPTYGVNVDRYVGTLNCGTKENYWCEDFDSWYKTTQDTYPNTKKYPTIEQIKSASISTLNSSPYKDALQTMLGAYNVMNYPAMGFTWTTDLTDKKTGSIEYSYIMHCTRNATNASCADVNAFYPDLVGKSCEMINDYDFSQFNAQNNKSVTGEWYTANCGCTNPVSYDCTPIYNLGTCITGDNLNYKDSSDGVVTDEYWENCVFEDNGTYDMDVHKESNHNAALTYYEKSLGSGYCEVYCVEQVTASFASPNISVEAGSHFYWEDSIVRGGRTCKTKTVEWDKFASDLIAANAAIRQSYVDWQLELLVEAKVAAPDVYENSSSCDCIENRYPVECCTKRQRDESWTKCPKDDPDCKPKKVYSDWYCAPGYEAPTRYNLNVVPAQTFKIIQGEENTSKREQWCDNENAPKTDVKTKSDTYEANITLAETHVNDMKACYNWDESTIYNVKPTAKLTYSDNTNYNYSDNLVEDTVYTDVTDNLAQCIILDVEQIKGCKDDDCPSTDVEMKNCATPGVTMERTAKTVFTLPEDVFRYVLKNNNLSIHSGQLDSFKIPDFTTNYYDMYSSNLPVSYSAPNGAYGTMHGRGTLDVDYSTLGHIKDNSTMVDTILSANAADAGTFGRWECQFTVYSDYIPCVQGDTACPNKAGDISVVYRPIDLENPFPDIDGSNRNTGSNWCNNGLCSSTNPTVEEYILNNRGVKSNEVYNEEPMYTFTLTPTTIRLIRAYNDANSYADYGGIVNGAEILDFVCTTGLSLNCRSEFVDYLAEIADGTCMLDTYRSNMTTDGTAFESCRQ